MFHCHCECLLNSAEYLTFFISIVARKRRGVDFEYMCTCNILHRSLVSICFHPLKTALKSIASAARGGSPLAVLESTLKETSRFWQDCRLWTYRATPQKVQVPFNPGQTPATSYPKVSSSSASRCSRLPRGGTTTPQSSRLLLVSL